MKDSSRQRSGRSLLDIWLVTVLLMIAIGVVGVLMRAILLPRTVAAREEKRRTQCAENLRQIGLAIESYHQKYGCYPPAFIADEHGKPKHSWRVLLLPFLGQEDLYAKYRFDESWNGEHNRALVRRMPAVYRCPSDPGRDLSQTSYAMIVGPAAVSDGPTSRRRDDIKDGPSNTIMVAEATEMAIGWMQPRDFPADAEWRRDACELFGNHDPIANVLYCDGSVRALSSEAVNARELETMMTVDGGEQPVTGR